MKSIILILTFFASPLVNAQNNEALFKTEIINEIPIKYYQHVPEAFNPENKYPTLLLINTLNAGEDNIFYKKLAAAAKRQGFLVFRFSLSENKNNLKLFMTFLKSSKNVNTKQIHFLSDEKYFQILARNNNFKSMIILHPKCGKKSLNIVYPSYKSKRLMFVLNPSHTCLFTSNPNWYFLPFISTEKQITDPENDFYQNTGIYNILSFIKRLKEV